MATILELDVNRTLTLEPPLHLHRHANQFTLPAKGKNVLYQWGSGTWTLQPIQLTPAFSSTSTWDELKFRLADVKYSPDWWSEVPERNIPDFPDAQGSDFFFNGIVPNKYIPASGQDLLSMLVDITGRVALFDLELQDGKTAGVMESKANMPANQGFTIRFRVDGRQSFKRGFLFDFYFGQYCLRINTDGTAEIWISQNMQKFGLCQVFNWGSGVAEHGTFHELTIFPHGRNLIEFICANTATRADLNPRHQTSGILDLPKANGTNSYIFKSPEKLSLILDGPLKGSTQITAPATWFLNVNREFRPYMQVSRLGFLNGNDNVVLYDTPWHFGYSPTMPLNLGVDFDKNGGRISATLWNADTLKQFIEDGKSSVAVFGARILGQGDVAKGLGSSTTPEFYGYALEKAAKKQTSSLTPVQLKVLRGIDIDYGDSPESERVTVEVNNAQGQANAYKRRPHIPARLFDDETGVVFFEGTVRKVRNFKSLSKLRLRFELRGMADKPLRTYPFDMDFTVDPSNPDMKPYSWQSVARKIASACAFDEDSEIVFEDAIGGDGAVWDFPLWPDGDADSAGGKKDVHAPQQRWRPNPQVPVYQFWDNLIRDIFGWNWLWDRARPATGDQPARPGRWLNHKRPQPEDRTKRPTLARFFSDAEMFEAAKKDDSGIPCYWIQGDDFEEETERPECTTFVGYTVNGTGQRKTKQELEDLLQRQQEDPDITDTAFDDSPRIFTAVWDNPNGYDTPQRTADHTSPDWMIDQHFRALNLTMAGNQEAFAFVGKRAYQDLCHGHVYDTFVSDWGDTVLAYLKKWDPIEIDGERFLLDRAQPTWSLDKLKRAQYRASLEREDAPPPYSAETA